MNIFFCSLLIVKSEKYFKNAFFCIFMKSRLSYNHVILKWNLTLILRPTSCVQTCSAWPAGRQALCSSIGVIIASRFYNSVLWCKTKIQKEWHVMCSLCYWKGTGELLLLVSPPSTGAAASSHCSPSSPVTPFASWHLFPQLLLLRLLQGLDLHNEPYEGKEGEGQRTVRTMQTGWRTQTRPKGGEASSFWF